MARMINAACFKTHDRLNREAEFERSRALGVLMVGVRYRVTGPARYSEVADEVALEHLTNARDLGATADDLLRAVTATSGI